MRFHIRVTISESTEEPTDPTETPDSSTETEKPPGKIEGR